MSDDPSVKLRRGGLYLSGDLCRRYFAGLETVILLRRERDLVIMPVRHAASGGHLLKRLNPAGDRVVTAPDFFRTHGAEDENERVITVDWITEEAALVARGVFV